MFNYGFREQNEQHCKSEKKLHQNELSSAIGKRELNLQIVF